MREKRYICIDLKSFFASVECVDRGLDPFEANLVVADPTRTDKTICLAVTPAMKEQGVRNRCRVFEIPKSIPYIIAPPRMKRYEEVSAQVYGVYLRYIAPEDIHVYSIDECFLDVTDYLKLYKKTDREMAKFLIDEVYRKTGICATAGIGTNLFLAKVALDVTAKHASDRLGYLDKAEFERTIWHHRPITDIWNIGKGIAARLEKYGIYDLYGVAHYPEDVLYREFGVNAELLIDHARGEEPCTIEDIHRYRPESRSLSNGQVFGVGYTYEHALTAVKEMADMLVLELVERGLVTDSISLFVGYDKETGHTGGTRKLPWYTDSYRKLREAFVRFYEATTRRDRPIRRLNVGLNNVVSADYATFDLFTDREKEEKEHTLQKTVLELKRKFGKNAVLRGMNFEEGATARERNRLIGGHRSGEDDEG